MLGISLNLILFIHQDEKEAAEDMVVDAEQRSVEEVFFKLSVWKNNVFRNLQVNSCGS